MEKSANTISRLKFSKLSSRSCHRLLASLAKDALEKGCTGEFFTRYEELQSATELDRYHPPYWLSKEEAIEEYLAFHRFLSLAPSQPPEKKQGISWQHQFDVEIVVDQVRSPYNIGSILRIIDNFALKRLVHSCHWLSLEHPQLRKAARGCEKWIPVRFETNLITYLKNAAVPVIGVENENSASPISQWKPPEKCILVLGNETYGLAAEIRKCCSSFIFIPMHGFKKSMNVTHALAVTAQRIVEGK